MPHLVGRAAPCYKMRGLGKILQKIWWNYLTFANRVLESPCRRGKPLYYPVSTRAVLPLARTENLTLIFNSILTIV